MRGGTGFGRGKGAEGLVEREGKGAEGLLRRGGRRERRLSNRSFEHRIAFCVSVPS